MSLDGRLRHADLVGDQLVRQAPCKELEHPLLGYGEGCRAFGKSVAGVGLGDFGFPQSERGRFGAGGDRGDELAGLIKEPADLLIEAGVAAVPIAEMQANVIARTGCISETFGETERDV